MYKTDKVYRYFVRHWCYYWKVSDYHDIMTYIKWSQMFALVIALIYTIGNYSDMEEHWPMFFIIVTGIPVAAILSILPVLIIDRVRNTFNMVPLLMILSGMVKECIVCLEADFNPDTFRSHEKWCMENCNGRYYVFQNNLVNPVHWLTMTEDFHSIGIMFWSSDDLLRFKMVNF